MKAKLKRLYERIFCYDTDAPTYERTAMKKVDAVARRLKLDEPLRVEELFFRNFNAVGYSMRRVMEKGGAMSSKAGATRVRSSLPAEPPSKARLRA